MPVPETDVRGCYFHFVYNVLKQVKNKGGQLDLRNNISFSIAISHVKALAFLPSDQVCAAYETIVRPMLLDSVANKEMAISVCNYLEHTYMGKRRTRKNITAPLFSPSMWSHHQTVVGDSVRVRTYCPENNNVQRKKKNARYDQINKILQRLNTANTSIVLGDIARLV